MTSAEESYRRLRETVGVYRRAAATVAVRGRDRTDYLSALLGKRTEFAQPGTAVETVVLDTAGQVVGMAVVIVDDDDVVLMLEMPASPLDHLRSVRAATDLVEVEFEDLGLVVLACEGPLAWAVAGSALGEPIGDVLLNEWRHGELDSTACRVVRLGTTAEYGYLVLVPEASAAAAEDALTHAAADAGGGPVADEALERARAEVNYPVLPQQVDGLTPFEAGLQWYLTLDRDDDYVGKAALRFEAPQRRLAAAIRPGGDMPAAGCVVFDGDVPVGHVQVSSPRSGHPDGLGLLILDEPYSAPGSVFTVDGQEVRTVSRPVVEPLSWVRQIGERT